MALVYNESTGEFEERRVNPDVEFIKNQFKNVMIILQIMEFRLLLSLLLIAYLETMD